MRIALCLPPFATTPEYRNLEHLYGEGGNTAHPPSLKSAKENGHPADKCPNKVRLLRSPVR
jgi:hypothetical protein